MRWIALHLPLLPLETFCATLPAADAARPVALVKDHQLAQVNRAAAERGVPGVAAPSANRFGRVSPTTAAHVVDELGDALCVLDGGACPVGIESAIVDCTRPQPALLRPLPRSRLGPCLCRRHTHTPRMWA